MWKKYLIRFTLLLNGDNANIRIQRSQVQKTRWPWRLQEKNYRQIWIYKIWGIIYT